MPEMPLLLPVPVLVPYERDDPSMFVWIAIGIYGSAIVVLILAAISDVRSLTIPNRLVLALLCLWPILLIVPPIPPLAEIGWHIATGAAFFAVALALFAFNLAGGGDGKLLAVLGLWVGPGDALLLLFVIALAGGLVGLAMLTVAILGRYRFPGLPTPTVRQELKRQIPYGVAIAIGGMVICGQRMGALVAGGL